MIGVPGLGGYSILLIQKQDEDEKQCCKRRRILIVDDDVDITFGKPKHNGDVCVMSPALMLCFVVR